MLALGRRGSEGNLRCHMPGTVERHGRRQPIGAAPEPYHGLSLRGGPLLSRKHGPIGTMQPSANRRQFRQNWITPVGRPSTREAARSANGHFAGGSKEVFGDFCVVAEGVRLDLNHDLKTIAKREGLR
jgi:hypothetical protein